MRAAPRELAARAAAHEVVVAESVDDQQHDVARIAQLVVRQISSGGCSALPPRAATIEATRLTRLPPE